MPMLKPGTIFPTDEEDAAITAAALSDPDNPPLDEDWFARARPAKEVLPPALYAALTDRSTPPTIRLVSDAEDAARQAARGHPSSTPAKVPVNLQLAPDVLSAFKAIGSDWQARMEMVLREAVAAGKVC